MSLLLEGQKPLLDLQFPTNSLSDFRGERFTRELDARLTNLIEDLKLLRAVNQVDRFILVLHDDVDLDALGAARGVRRLLHDLFSGQVTVDIVHNGVLAKEFVSAGVTGLLPIAHLEAFIQTPAEREKIGVLLIDNPYLQSPKVLPSSLDRSAALMNLIPDVVLDHHRRNFRAEFGLSWIIEEQAGSTSAIVHRLLEVATECGEIKDHWKRDRLLATLMVGGALADAGISFAAGIPADLGKMKPFGVPMVRELAPFVDQIELAKLDLSTLAANILLPRACKSFNDIGAGVIGDMTCRMVTGYVGTTPHRNLLGACADQFHSLVLEHHRKYSTDETLLSGVYGLISETVPKTLRAGDSVFVSFRGKGDVPVEMAKVLGWEGGGRDDAAAVCWPIHSSLHGKPLLCLRKIINSMVRKRVPFGQGKPFPELPPGGMLKIDARE